METTSPGVRRGLALLVVAAACSVPSAAAAAPPVNDDFATATLITGLPASVSGNNAGATKEVGEPDHGPGGSGGRSVWWTWTAPASEAFEITACGIGPIYIGVYRGDRVDALVQPDGLSRLGSYVCDQATFDATAGEVYRIAIDSPSEGDVTLGFRGPPANDDFADAEAITGFPAAVIGDSTLATTEPGEPNHARRGFPGSVWWKWTAPSSGAVLITTCHSASENALAVYTGNGIDALRRIASDGGRGCGSTVELYAIADNEYRIAVAGTAGRIKLSLKAPQKGDITGRAVSAVLLAGRAWGTVFDVAADGRTRHTRRNQVLGVRGRIAPPVLPGTPGRRDICLDWHFHGRLLGRPDPHPRGCGWGPVAAYGRLPWIDRQRAAAITGRRLALRTGSLRYAISNVHKARGHLDAVVGWMIGWGDESFEEVEEAVWDLEGAERILRRATRASTRGESRRLLRHARSLIRDSMKIY